ncbi:MAG TPA: hypothetical protein VMV05_10470 [bacterium]|nr:hypothetical protein [bacterium]
MKKMKFEAKVFEGHMKLIAIHLPLDPARVWGKQPRYFVKGTVEKCRFTGEIGFRRGFHYMLLDKPLLMKAGLAVGDLALFVLEPRKPSTEELAEKPNLAWARVT